VAALAPALGLLLTGVPLAVLLDRAGFFDAAATVVSARRASALGLWLLAAATTALLNLDTTVVLLTPLYIRIARQRRADAFAVAVIPLLLADLASSVLPVSNLTTLIAAERLNLSVLAVVGHLGPPTVAAVTVGWFCFRRWGAPALPPVPFPLPTGPGGATLTVDRRALRRGGVVVAGVLVGFTVGPALGVPAWTVALVADLVLVAMTGHVPWRSVPLATAAGVMAVAVVVEAVVPPLLLAGLLRANGPAGAVGAVAAATVAAGAVNNLPALLAALPALRGPTWAMWGWLLGVNAGAALVPLGALANLLWWRVARRAGVEVSLGRYLSVTVSVALPALVAATAVLAVEAALLPA
jgi:arsenical pump membrane protein